MGGLFLEGCNGRLFAASQHRKCYTGLYLRLAVTAGENLKRFKAIFRGSNKGCYVN